MILHSPENKKTVERTIYTRSTAVTSGSDRNKNPVAPNTIQETNTATDDSRMADQKKLARHTIATKGNQRGSMMPSSLDSLPVPAQAMALPITITANNLKELTQALLSPALPITEFSGFDHEDSEAYLRKCEHYLIQTELARNHWASTAGRGLQGAAGKWWSPYKSFNLSWEELCELLTNKFPGTATILRLPTQLYSTKQ